MMEGDLTANNGGRLLQLEEDNSQLRQRISSLEAELWERARNEAILEGKITSMEGTERALRSQLFEREMEIRNLLSDCGTTGECGTGSTSRGAVQFGLGASLGGCGAPSGGSLKVPLRHHIPLTMMPRFRQIVKSCLGPDEDIQTEAIATLSVDPDLGDLLPSLVTFLSTGITITEGRRDLSRLILFLRMAESVVANETLEFGELGAELLDSIRPCLVAPCICFLPHWEVHWEIRRHAAGIIAKICKRSPPPDDSVAVKSHNEQQLLEAILEDENSSMGSLYGAIAGLWEFGDGVIETALLPQLLGVGARVEVCLTNAHISEEDKVAAQKILDLVVHNLSPLLKSQSTIPEGLSEYQTEFGFFGESLLNAVLAMEHGSEQNQCYSEDPVASLAEPQSLVIRRKGMERKNPDEDDDDDNPPNSEGGDDESSTDGVTQDVPLVNLMTSTSIVADLEDQDGDNDVDAIVTRAIFPEKIIGGQGKDLGNDLGSEIEAIEPVHHPPLIKKSRLGWYIKELKLTTKNQNIPTSEQATKSRGRGMDNSPHGSDADPPEPLQGMSGSSKPSPRASDPGSESTRKYFRCGNSVPVLHPDHDLDGDGVAIQFRAFMASVHQQCLSISSPLSSKYYMTDHGIWLPTIVRYGSVGDKNRTIRGKEDKDFWKRYVSCPSSAAITIRALCRYTEKPICVIVRGQTGVNSKKRHSVLVALVKVDGVRVCYVKDPMPAHMMAPTLRLTVFLKQLFRKDDSFTMIGMLGEDEPYSADTDSLRETYKAVGDILDGNPFWNREGVQCCTRRFQIRSDYK